QQLIEWREFEGVYVPTSYFSEWKTHYLQEGKSLEAENLVELRSSRSYKLEWQQVNQPVPDEEFEYASFGLPHRTIVFDYRVSPPAFVEMTGDPATVELRGD